MNDADHCLVLSNEEKNWKSDQKVVMDEELVQNDVLNEELVQNGAMNDKFVRNFVMEAKIDAKVVMDLSIFKIGWWNSLQPINQNLLEEFLDKNEPWLLIGIRSRDPFLVTQYRERHSVSSDQHMKKLMSLREGLHVMMQCNATCDSTFADGYWLHEHPGGHASRREPTMMKTTKRINHVFCERTCVQLECSERMQSESSEYVRKNNGFLHKQLENQNSLGEPL